MTDNQSSYRQIMKATSLFGGVQVFSIIISVVRSKFVAILLGPAGMGIMGLLNSTLGLIGGFTNFGLETSAVKDISAANSTKDNRQIAVVVTVLKRLVWITGFLGTLIVIFFSTWLSQATFGNKDYTIAFVWISITLLFSQLSSGQFVLLQGLRKLKHLAKANLLGSTLGLVVTVPIYYKWGIDGIVPGIIGSSIISLLFSWFYSRKIKIEPFEINTYQTFAEGKNMMRMGFMVSLGGLMSTLDAYLIRIFISQTGGVGQVGLYSAGFTMITMYMGLVLKGMGTDYYPRLSEVANDDELVKHTINKQTEIGLLIIAPMLIVFIVFIKWIIILLYSSEFSAINNMLTWAALGMFFRVPSWALGFVFLAKGNNKLFFFLQLFSHSLQLGLSIAGYYFWGLSGLGISILILYPTSFLVSYKINKTIYNFELDQNTIKIFVFQFCLAVVAFLAVMYSYKPFSYIFGISAIILSCLYSIKELDTRLGILSILKSYLNK